MAKKSWIFVHFSRKKSGVFFVASTAAVATLSFWLVTRDNLGLASLNAAPLLLAG
jgi:hypothetical protein